MTKPNLKCYICQKPIYRIPSKWNGHNVCSYTCRNKYYSKEKSFAYKHGKCIMDKNGKIGRNKKRDRTRDKLRRIAFKIKAINYLGGKCQICGYDKCIASLDFHHKDPKLKNKSIKDLSLGSWEKIQKELDKCILLCANCHRELHWNEKHGPEFKKEADEYLSTYVPKKEQKGPKHYMYGKHHSEETKRKLSKGKIGRDNPKARAVIVENKYFHTYKEAAEFVGVTPLTIKNRIRKKQPGYRYANKKDKNQNGL